MKHVGILAAALAVAFHGLGVPSSFAASRTRKILLEARTAQEESIHVPAFDLQASDYLGGETRAVLARQARESAHYRNVCPTQAPASAAEVVIQRQCEAKYYFDPLIARSRARYKVVISTQAIAGVATEIIAPADGVPAGNRQRVLINLHGGNFMYGGRWGGEVESIPIAAIGRFRIVSVNYRMGPEYRFPAASEDVAAVYESLLARYKPGSIGIYGCSAGGILTAESIAWFMKEHLPMPGAIGMFSGAAFLRQGDSGHIWAAIDGLPAKAPSAATSRLSYLTGVDVGSPLVVPGVSAHVMAHFPTSLLITATRDFLLSSVVATQEDLARLGVKTDLHVWEGLGHCFLYDPDVPQSREAYDVIARFFDHNLGNRAAENY